MPQAAVGRGDLFPSGVIRSGGGAKTSDCPNLLTPPQSGEALIGFTDTNPSNIIQSKKSSISL